MDEGSEIFDRDYFGQTVLHPLGLTAVLVLGLALLVLPRRYAVWPMIIMACFIAPAQRVAFLSLNFTLLRIMVLLGTIRIFARQEWRGFKWDLLDTMIIVWSVSATTFYILLNADLDAIKYKLGATYDAIGMYFLFRCLIRSWDDLHQVIVGFIVVSVPVVWAFLIEFTTRRNVFSAFGGVPETTTIREGRLRCQGAFAHPILAGCFWAVQMPMIAALWWRGRKEKLLAVLGCAMCAALVVFCASSTPVMAVIFVAVGALLFPLRWRMRWIRWGCVLALIILHLSMKKPVWHLVARIDIVGGSTGWYRFKLMDGAIRHFYEWWLMGTTSTDSWGDDLWDITNQYILEGVRGGFFTLLFFVTMIAVAFGRVGRWWRRCAADTANLAMCWALGVSLFAHVMNFFGVSYFGQMNMVWFMLLAIVGSWESISPASAHGRLAQSRSVVARVPRRLTRKPEIAVA